jgi:Tfp pilus assembly protein PilV
MRRMNNMQRNLGQTLIEVLITLVFIAVSVIAMIRFQNYLAYNNGLSQQKANAVQIAQSKMSSLQDFQVLNTTSGYTAYQDIVSGSSTVAGTTTNYTMTWTVTTFASPSYKQISIVVTWLDRYNVSQSITLVRNIAGLQPANSGSVM